MAVQFGHRQRRHVAGMAGPGLANARTGGQIQHAQGAIGAATDDNPPPRQLRQHERMHTATDMLGSPMWYGGGALVSRSSTQESFAAGCRWRGQVPHSYRAVAYPPAVMATGRWSRVVTASADTPRVWACPGLADG